MHMDQDPEQSFHSDPGLITLLDGTSIHYTVYSIPEDGEAQSSFDPPRRIIYGSRIYVHFYVVRKHFPLPTVKFYNLKCCSAGDGGAEMVCIFQLILYHFNSPDLQSRSRFLWS